MSLLPCPGRTRKLQLQLFKLLISRSNVLSRNSRGGGRCTFAPHLSTYQQIQVSSRQFSSTSNNPLAAAVSQTLYYSAVPKPATVNSPGTSKDSQQVQGKGQNFRDKKGIPKMARPAGVVYNWDFRTWTPEQNKELRLELITKIRAIFDSVANVDNSNLSFDTVLKPLLTAYREFYGSGNAMAGIVTLPLMVAQSAELREAATESQKLFDQTYVELSMRKDVFEKLVAYQEKLDEGDESIDPEYRRALDKLICRGRKNGLHLSDDLLEKATEIKKKILDLELAFTRNLIEYKKKLLFTVDELAGMPSDFIDSLEVDKETGKHIVTLEYPHLFPVLKKCRVPSTRRQLAIANNSKCYKENTQILEELLDWRHQEATLLGYNDHASFILDGETIANEPTIVENFLKDLAQKLQPLWEKERNLMLELKKEECEKYGYENSGNLELWDTSYYSNLVEERYYDLDQEELKPYFPVDAVTSGMLSIYEDLLNLKFTPLPGAEKWHDDVISYQVNDGETSDLMGYFYLDLFPREGKYGHACWVPMQTNVPDENGKGLPVIGAMLTNFTKPSGDKPALLTHSEVETYFHEFGHLMHGMCTKAKTQLFFGTNVERDFLEAPSQMLENWVWETAPLQRMSRHYTEGHQLPEDLIEKLKNTKKANAGAFNLRQIVFGTFDQLIHQSGRCDTESLFAETLKKIQGLDAVPETNFAAGFGHIGKGYTARYYGYLWSEVFSMDMYKTRFSKNNMDSEAGKLYRKCILEPGGSVDGNQMLRNFLGRDPNSDAFLESKGVEVKK